MASGLDNFAIDSAVCLIIFLLVMGGVLFIGWLFNSTIWVKILFFIALYFDMVFFSRVFGKK
ncbi:MAG: hypothetical protein IKO65_03510 [Victivallales bacterium]|nr:hypothetical protein [Victivallales bacterium]